MHLQTKVKKSQASTFEEIDGMERKTFTGKIKFTPQEADQLKNLAKKAISASAVISDLKKAPEAVTAFLSRILYIEKSDPEQERKQRETTLVK